MLDSLDKHLGTAEQSMELGKNGLLDSVGILGPQRCLKILSLYETLLHHQ